MAPKRKTETHSDEEDEIDVKQQVKKRAPPAAKKAAAAKPPPRSSPADEASAGSGDDDDEEVKVKVNKTPGSSRAKKTPTVKEPFKEGDWNIVPPSLLWREYGKTKPSAKVAAYDLDGTLVHTKSHRTFPSNADDWRWFNKKVAAAIKEQRDGGYKIVVISNQNGIKSALTGKLSETIRGRMDQVAAELGPLQVLMATQQDDFRKPGTGMWKFFVDNCNGGVQPDLKKSFYVGDAAGRPEDFAASDKEFAAAVGLPFKTPEDVFGAMEGKASLPPAAAPAGGAAACPDNQGLVDAFKALADAYFSNKDIEKANFKGAAAKKAGSALAAYSVKLTKDNYKQAKKLPGVGDGSLKLILEFLETGKIQALEEMTAGGGGAGAGGAGGAGGPGSEAKKKAAAKAEETLKFA